MWQNINGEWLWMDQEMGYEEVERERVVAGVGLESYTQADVRDAGRRLTKGDIALGVAGGMIVAKAAPRIGGWLLWMAVLAVALMVFM
jgi:hypothetical protein